MKKAILGVLVLLFTLVQSTLVEYIRVWGVKPDIVLVLVVCIALLRGSFDGSMTGLLAGVLKDLLFGKIFGLQGIIFMYLGILVGNINKKLFKENVLVVIMITFLSSICAETVFYIFTAFVRGQTDILFFLKTVIFPAAVYNSVVSVLVFIIAMKVNVKLNEVENLWRKY